MDGDGAMLCFGVKNGLKGGKILMNKLRLITLTVSLGGVESLIEHPASMTHATVPRKEREASGILDKLFQGLFDKDLTVINFCCKVPLIRNRYVFLFGNSNVGGETCQTTDDCLVSCSLNYIRPEKKEVLP